MPAPVLDARNVGSSQYRDRAPDRMPSFDSDRAWSLQLMRSTNLAASDWHGMATSRKRGTTPAFMPVMAKKMRANSAATRHDRGCRRLRRWARSNHGNSAYG